MLKNKSLKLAGVVAYLFIIVNTISGFVLGPAILSRVGSNAYGVYTSVNAIVSAVMIADLGVSETLIRFVADYRANHASDEKIGKLCKTVKTINYVLVLISIVAGIVIYTLIPEMYKGTFSADEILAAQKMMGVCIVSIAATLLTNYYSGIIAGYGYFTYINITKTISVLVKLVLSLLVVWIFADVYVVVLVNAIISVAIYFVDLWFFKTYINIRLVYGFTKITVLKELLIYTIFIFIQTIVDQVNSNLDSIIIGMIEGAAVVAIYSFGLVIFHMFQQLSTSISQMLVPYMSNIVANEAKPRDIEDSLIRIGRIQYIVMGAVYFGFWSLGRLFIEIWLGDGYGSVWIIAIILMTGGLFPLIQNGAIALLKAQNLMGFRTTSLFISALVNAVVTIVLVSQWGYVYASIGTALGFVVVNTILMDLYYYKKLHLNMARVLWSILRKITAVDIVCAVVAILVQFVLNNVPPFLRLLLSGTAFCIVYGILVYFLVCSKEERNMILRKFVKR